jgi:hypothetical protein
MRARGLALTGLTTLGVLGGALALPVASAVAVQRYGPISGHIGEAGPGGSGGGEFSGPDGVAIDQATGDVYVVDTGNNRVEKFEASGTYLSQLDGTETPSGAFSEPTAVAVDQASGDVYVVDSGHDVVDKFTASGSYICELSGWGRGCQATPGGAPTFDDPHGVAVDPTTGGANSGDVYVSDKENKTVDAFTDDGGDVSHLALDYRPWSLAVDSNSDLYVAGAGAEQVHEFTPSGLELREYAGSILGARIRTVGVDQDTDDVFIGAEPIESGGYEVAEFGSLGQAAPGAEENIFGDGLVSSPPETDFSPGIAVNSTSHAVYVADPVNNVVDIFAPVTVPTPTTGGTSNLEDTSVTLEGVVNSEKTAGVEYFFQYGTSSSYGSETEHTSVGEGEAEQALANVTNLEPDTTYHYRLDATNSLGLVSYGEEETVTTSGPPTVTAESASGVTSSAVTLEGQVNPNRSAVTICEFEYAPEAVYQQALEEGALNPYEHGGKAPCGPLPGAGQSSEPVTTNTITGLEPGTVYHYRLSVSNASGTAAGLCREESKLHTCDELFRTSVVAPTVQATPATNVSQFEATLNAGIDPEGTLTSWHFEYIDEAHYRAALAAGAQNPYAYEGAGGIAPSPDRYAPINDRADPIAQEVSGLKPGTTYHYAVVVFSPASDQTIGPDQTFTTAPIPLPAVTTGTPSNVTQGAVSLSGEIDPQGWDTTYHFQYGTSTAYGQNWPTIDTEIGALNGNQPVKDYVENLQPGTTYHYRLVATNAAGSSYGADQIFTTTSYVASIVQETPLGAMIGIPQPKQSATTPKTVSRAQKLADALKTCRRKPRRRQAKCEQQARRLYGPVKKKKRA